ncbi:hypothetical protein [Marinimicrococcus flavescens]|uniref:Uncharacterized protein n=1 Tax=Marinimicrococcus flavescens TaxID=3031815 RepID=A0AAP3XQ03_9PROT|nr:hypothetical protein [Marinimicrococcus flavescens]
MATRPVKAVSGDTFYLDVEGTIDDPALQCFAGCVRELAPVIAQSAVRHGHGATLAALVAIAANRAIDVGAGVLIAEAFRHSAEMLDAHARRAPAARRA